MLKRSSVLFSVVLLAAPYVASGQTTPTPAPAVTTSMNACLGATDSDYANISINPCNLPQKATKCACTETALSVKVTDPAIRAKLKPFRVGDVLRLELTDKNELKDVLGAVSKDVSPLFEFLVIVACALLLLGFAAAVTKGAPQKFVISPEDNRYSNSKFQIALWFWVLLSTYLATVVLRVSAAGWDFLGAVSIPQNLLVLSGLSAITYGGAKAITTSKVQAAQNPVAAPGAVAAPAPNADPKHALMPGQESFFRDLLQNDVGTFDFGDFQMLVVTLVAIGMYLALIFHFLSSIQLVKATALPDVDSTILAVFGLGQGAYLAKKAGGEVGKS